MRGMRADQVPKLQRHGPGLGIGGTLLLLLAQLALPADADSLRQAAREFGVPGALTNKACPGILAFLCPTKTPTNAANIRSGTGAGASQPTPNFVSGHGRRSSVGIIGTVRHRSPGVWLIGELTENERENLTAFIVNGGHCGDFGQRISLQQSSTWLCSRSKSIAVLSAASSRILSENWVNVDDCAWLWTIATERARSEACFVKHATWLSGSSAAKSCFLARWRISKQRAPDAAYLCVLALWFNVPAEVLLAVSWMETRFNVRPTIRGSHGEWGRFQIRSATAKHLCKGLDIKTYAGNTVCGAAILRYHRIHEGSWRRAVRRYNGRGQRAEVYVGKIERVLGEMVLESVR